MEEREFLIKSEEFKVFLEGLDLAELLYFADIMSEQLDEAARKCEILTR